jgi:uracil-DNA glycosylase
MQNEFSTLLADLKEQILYLQELGVENFDVQLPEFEDKFQNIKQIQTPKAEPQNRLERFIPDDLQILQPPKIEPKVNLNENQSRINILEKSKLSRLPSLPKREPNNFSFQPNQPIEPPKIETMPTKKIIEEDLTESLFGDITQTLPDANETIEDIRAEIGNCTRCTLCEGRTKIVHSTGNLQADLMFVGEAPGADEDAQGVPFVGRAGQLLTKIIESIGMKREEVFIGNINRCRPPGNRQPTPPETAACKPFLLRDIAVVRPKVVVVLGNTACQNLLETKVGITKLRGNFQDYFGVKVMPTFHPAYLLRDPSKKRETWEDMKKVRDYLNGLK